MEEIGFVSEYHIPSCLGSFGTRRLFPLVR